jgi:hypothetical protein
MDFFTVGESSRHETAITVTGLKPAHFYNVRVIAVGANNFQAGSRVFRLRTYGRDGRPGLGGGRMPSNLSIDDAQNGSLADSSDEATAARSHTVGIETATVPEGGQIMVREPSGGHPGQRRNTGGRRHSPSINNADQLSTSHREPQESMQRLTEKYESIRSDTDDAIAQVLKDAEEFNRQWAELTKERDEKRHALKEKEEASEKLKKEVHISERANRQAQNKKSQKEKALRDKQAERTKMQNDIVKWRKEIEDMKREREKWKLESEERRRLTEKKSKELQETITRRQGSLTGMEEEIRVKGLQIKELEEERQKLPGAQDEESQQRDAVERQTDLFWDQREKEASAKYNNQLILLRQLEIDIQRVQSYIAATAARQATTNPVMYHGNSSGVDFDPSGRGKSKQRKARQRKSRTNTISSPIAGHPITDSPFPSAAAYNNFISTASPTYAAGPYFDLNSTAPIPIGEQANMTDSDVLSLTNGAPLSPTATSLLPAGIFTDDEPNSPQLPIAGTYAPLFSGLRPSYDNDPQSPESSSRSASLMSSPQVSYQNLPGHPDSASDGDHRSLHSLGPIGSASGPGARHSGGRQLFGGLFDFPRVRGKQDDGLAFGSLRPGQSRSFPRQTEENESSSARQRRTSFSTNWSSFLGRSATAGAEIAEGNGPAMARNSGARRRRGFNMFSSNFDEPHSMYPDRDPSSPRPASIASSDLPRPSTDSGLFGWPAAEGGNLNRNSPLATNWSIAPSHPWSRAASRRPSISHGSSSALAGGIASEDDDFLPPETLTYQSSPPPVGVIGTRPTSSHKPVTPKLNPTAPAFKGINTIFGKSISDEVKDEEHTDDPTLLDTSPPQMDDPFPLDEASPTNTRKSRDTRSIHTQDSIAESYDSLDHSISNTPSSEPSASVTRESGFRQLLRKGSSSKFFSSRDKTGHTHGFFGGKKAGSTANSERSLGGGSISGDVDDLDETGRSFDSVGRAEGRESMSVTSSPAAREGRRSVNWGRFGFRKGREEGESTAGSVAEDEERD